MSSPAVVNGKSRTNVAQACAVPFRRVNAERLEFCLVTSSRGQWLFPKGFIDPGDEPRDTAIREAFEEAGLIGRVVGKPLGYYQAAKGGTSIEVAAVLMEVLHSEPRWPEWTVRRRRWVNAKEAIALLGKPQLVELLELAVARLRRK
jgi:8-oxo-dGTP pyrophosphatase MutT (NUDIX family)